MAVGNWKDVDSPYIKHVGVAPRRTVRLDTMRGRTSLPRQRNMDTNRSHNNEFTDGERRGSHWFSEAPQVEALPEQNRGAACIIHRSAYGPPAVP
jgi:hypothetical protein